MPKILFALTSDIYVRNYLRTGVLSELMNEMSVDLIANQDLALSAEVSQSPGFKAFFELNPRVNARHHLVFNLLMWRNRKKSRTFFYRWLRNSNWHLVKKEGGLISRLLSVLVWTARAIRNPHGLRIPLLANRVLFPLSFRILKALLPVNRQLKEFISTENYDLIVFPSAAFDSVSVDLARLGRLNGVPSLCLIDNWDNLTSKTVFWEKPDHLGVWGKQASQQAQSIHGFTPRQIHLLGTPRFDSYFELRKKPVTKRHYDFPYLLFVGSAMPFDEIGTLKLLDELVSQLDGMPAGLKVVYRPHPWQQKRNSTAVFNANDFSHVLLDLQMKAAFERGIEPERTEPSFQPNLDYYPSLLKGAEAVVGPLTTMLFEASLCLRPVIALSYFDGFHANTSRRYFVHFEGMDSVPGFQFCEQVTELPELILTSLSEGEISESESDAATSFYLFQNDESYPQRLLATMREIIALKSRTVEPSNPDRPKLVL